MSVIPLVDIYCANPEHQDQIIIGFCSKQNCQQVGQICNQCLIEIHQDHSNSVMKFEDIKNLSIKLKNSILKFLQLINQAIDELVKYFEQIKINFDQQVNDFVTLEELIDAKQYSSVKERVKLCKKLQNMNQSNFIELISLFLFYQGKNSNKIKKLSFEISNLLIEIFRFKKKEDEIVEADADLLNQYEDNEFYAQQIELSQLLFQEAQELIQTKYYSEALQKFKEACLLDNQNHEIYFQRGKLLFTLKDNYQALKDFDNTIRLNNKNGLAYSYKGQILNKLQRFKESIQCFEKAQSFNECQTTQLFSEMAYAYYQLQEYELALECVNKVTWLDSQNSRAFNFKSIILIKIQKFDDAKQTIDQAIELEPDNADYLINKACILHQLQHIDEALNFFEQAEQINDENPRLYRKKIELLKSRDKQDEVLLCYQKWMKYEPSNQNVRQQTIKYLKSIGRHQEARQLEQGLVFQI